MWFLGGSQFYNNDVLKLYLFYKLIERASAVVYNMSNNNMLAAADGDGDHGENSLYVAMYISAFKLCSTLIINLLWYHFNYWHSSL